jgi:hypothetical protein
MSLFYVEARRCQPLDNASLYYRVKKKMTISNGKKLLTFISDWKSRMQIHFIMLPLFTEKKIKLGNPDDVQVKKQFFKRPVIVDRVAKAQCFTENNSAYL